MEETRQQSLIEMSRQLEEMRAHQAQQTEAEEQRYRAQELRSQAMQENISRMVEMMRTLMPRPVTYPSSSNHGNTTTPTLPHPSPRPPEPVDQLMVVKARRAPLNPPGSNRSTDGVSKIAENLNQGELTLGTDSSVLVAHQVLDKMPELFADKIDLEIAHVSSIEELHDLEAFGNDVSEQVVWALGNIVGDSPQCRDLARQSDLAAHQVLEEMPKPTKTIEVIGVLTKDDDDDDLLGMASWIEADFEPPTYTKGYMKLMCFDPGGNFAGVLLEMHIVDYDLSYYCHLNSIELIRWPAKLNLERSDFGFKTLIPTWSSLLISVELFIFDPGGMIISSASSVMPLVHKTLQEWSIEVRIAGKIATFGHKRVIHVGEVTAKLLYLKNGINGVYYSALYNDMSRYVCCAGYRGASSGIVFKKTYISVWKEALNPTLASVAYVLKFKFDVLIKLEMDASYLLNHLGLLATGCGNLTFTWKYIYICIETFIFDPGGSWFLHSELKVTIARLIFDPGGQCSRFTETGSFVSCLLWLCNQGYELIIKNSSQEQYFCLILGDKDHLKEGVLLQDFGN